MIVSLCIFGVFCVVVILDLFEFVIVGGDDVCVFVCVVGFHFVGAVFSSPFDMWFGCVCVCMFCRVLFVIIFFCSSLNNLFVCFCNRDFLWLFLFILAFSYHCVFAFFLSVCFVCIVGLVIWCVFRFEVVVDGA